MVIALSCLLQAASAAPKIFIQPSSSTVANGSTFTVNIVVGPMGSEITSAECNLQFDNTHLRAISLTPGTFLSQSGEATDLNPYNDFNNTDGTVMYGEWITAAPDENTEGVRTQGTLASITFEAICDGVTGGLDFAYLEMVEVIGRDEGSIKVTYLYTSDIDANNGSYMVSSYPKGDLDHNWASADVVDVIMMIQASVGDITPNPEYDLDGNGNNADVVDVIMMIQASVGDIIL
jgi:hypothetical protein